jgi:epoxide hydrolase-like predicted phosphatase
MPTEPAHPRGLLVDWGGVLTSNVFVAFEAFCEREGLPPDRVMTAFRGDARARDALAGLETGALAEAAFEVEMAAHLGVSAERLIERMMSAVTPDTMMAAAVARARRRGIRTGLISNSWGVDNYDATLMGSLFDGLVISARVGLRKPEPEIYEMGARSIGLAPSECVFVDDLPGNLKPARTLGMIAVHHRDAATTIAELSNIFGVDLGGGAF